MKLQAFFYCPKCGKHTYSETPSLATARECATQHINIYHNGDTSLIRVGRFNTSKLKKAILTD